MTQSLGKLFTLFNDHIGLQTWIKFLMFIFILGGTFLLLSGFYLISQTDRYGFLEISLIILGGLQFVSSSLLYKIHESVPAVWYHIGVIIASAAV